MQNLNFCDLHITFEQPARLLTDALRREPTRPILLLGQHRTQIAMPVPGLLAALSNTEVPGPLRAPHHTASEAAFTGTDRFAGEIELAKNGVLLLDDADMIRDIVLDLIKRDANDTNLVFGIAPEHRFAEPNWLLKRIEHIRTVFNPIVIEVPSGDPRPTSERCASTQTLADE
ncbi:MAG: ATP-binding protein [bacterium]